MNVDWFLFGQLYLSYNTQYWVFKWLVDVFLGVVIPKLYHSILIQLPFQEPKLEVPTIYKAYIRLM